MAPDEKALRLDVVKPAFRAGVIDRRWSLINMAWPHVFIAIMAKDGRGYVLRFDCTGFPSSAPTAGLWDTESNRVLPLDSWPRSGGGRLGEVFRRDWKGGCALYLPCDRVTIASHQAWHNQMPSKIWRPSAGLIQYLELVYELLNCPDYLPPVSAVA